MIPVTPLVQVNQATQGCLVIQQVQEFPLVLGALEFQVKRGPGIQVVRVDQNLRAAQVHLWHQLHNLGTQSLKGANVGR